jgi:hypothetical protein
MVKPVSSYAAAGIAVGFKQGMQSLHHEKAVSSGGIVTIIVYFNSCINFSGSH